MGERLPTVDSFCATTSGAASEPIWGTAPPVRAWIVLEEPGAWEHKALASAGLGPLREILERWQAAVSGARVQLIRRPGSRSGCGEDCRRLYLAGVDADGPWLERYELSLAELSRFDAPARFADDVRDRPRCDERLVLLCTHGKRDRCCSLHGMAVYTPLAERYAHTWQSSHIKGHRFAATAVVLPESYYLGRLQPTDVEALASALERDELPPIEKVRGWTQLPRPAQAAELVLRERLGQRRFGALTHSSTQLTELQGGEQRATVRFVVEGEEHGVSLALKPFPEPVLESCGQEPIHVAHWREVAPGE